jgi:hypothetical protein
LGNKNFEEKKKHTKTKQNKTGGGGESFCFGYYSGDKKKHKSMGIVQKSFSLEKLHKSCQIVRENKS